MKSPILKRLATEIAILESFGHPKGVPVYLMDEGYDKLCEELDQPMLDLAFGRRIKRSSEEPPKPQWTPPRSA